MEATKIDFKKIREQLPHGALTEIAKRADVSLNTVHCVLKGKVENMDVLNVTVDYLEDYSAKKKKTFGRIAKILTVLV